MIKRLIKDLTYNNIKLSEGLNRAKIIAFEIKNSEFKEWINFELNGYKLEKLPKYRTIKCDIVADIQNPFYGKKTIPYDLSAWDDELQGMLYNMNILQSIPTIEANLKIIKDKVNEFVFEYLPVGLVQQFKGMTENGEDIVSIRRKIQVGQVMHVHEITKQKLVDTLLELNETFPNLEDDYQDTQANSELAKTIINNNIFGNSTNSNISFGDNVKQVMHIKKEKKIEEFLELINKLNLDKEDVEEVEVIIAENKDKPTFGKKLLTWTGKLATKAIEKGIELKIPEILAKVQEFV